MVRPKTYTESEQIAILHAVLLNKDILEAPKTKYRSEAWRIKWEEIAASIDAYFGTKRGATRVRSLYTHWKTAARKKHSVIKITALTEDAYEATLTMAERILRQICPDIFPKFGGEPTTSTNGDPDKATDQNSDKVTDEASDEATDEEEQSEPQPPENSKNGHEENPPNLPETKESETSATPSDEAKDCGDLEELIERAEPRVEVKNDLNPELPVLGNSDLDGLVLSLQSMIDIPSEIETAVANDPAVFENNQKMDDDIGEIVEAIKEFVQEKSRNDAKTVLELKNEDAGPSLDENEAMDTEEPLDLTRDDATAQNIVANDNEESKEIEALGKKEEFVSAVDEDNQSDAKEIEETKMEMNANAEGSEEKNAEGSEEKNAEGSEEKNAEENLEDPSEPPVAPETNVETDETSAENSKIAKPSVHVAVAEKRKKKQRARTVKKRKVTKGSSAV